MYKLHNDDCLTVLKTYPDNYFDSIVTDPPAGISFMGKDWDHDKGGRDAWIDWMTSIASECLRTLKPGGHALVWALPRTSHWTATAWENAGFEVRDRIGHIFGSGFPKSHDISKAIDKQAGAERKVVRKTRRDAGTKGDHAFGKGRELIYDITSPSTEEAKKWEGWGTALKPAIEDWWLFQKPCSEKTIAKNVLTYGTGAINIDACRVPSESIPINKLPEWSGFGQLEKPVYKREINDKGRWPAHLIHDGSEEVLEIFPDSDGQQAATRGDGELQENHIYGGGRRYKNVSVLPRSDKGSAARFFYCAKPTQAERNFGIVGPERDPASVTDFRPTLKTNPENWSNGTETPYTRTTKRKNNHPTVKAQALMKYLVTLITPPRGVVLDCFMGSGSTGVAALSLGFNFVGIESDKKSGYFEIASQRLLNTQEPLL